MRAEIVDGVLWVPRRAEGPGGLIGDGMQPTDRSDPEFAVWWNEAQESVVAAGFDPSKHPKVPRGKREGGQWARKRGYVAARATDAEMGALAAEFAADPALQLGGNGLRHGMLFGGKPGEDGALARIARAQGFDGLPEVVSHEELMSRLPQWAEDGRKINEGDGTVELWRGVSGTYEMSGHPAMTGEQIAEQFRHGDYFAGLGTYGSGVYTAEGRNVAVVYSDAGENRNGDSHDRAKPYASKSILHMGLKPEARVGKWSQVRSEWLAANGLEENNPGATTGKPYGGGVIYPKPPMGSLVDAGARGLYVDIGRYAASRGYDALQMDDGSGFWVVYNRTALVVAEAPPGGEP